MRNKKIETPYPNGEDLFKVMEGVTTGLKFALEEGHLKYEIVFNEFKNDFMQSGNNVYKKSDYQKIVVMSVFRDLGSFLDYAKYKEIIEDDTPNAPVLSFLESYRKEIEKIIDDNNLLSKHSPEKKLTLGEAYQSYGVYLSGKIDRYDAIDIDFKSFNRDDNQRY